MSFRHLFVLMSLTFFLRGALAEPRTYVDLDGVEQTVPGGLSLKQYQAYYNTLYDMLRTKLEDDDLYVKFQEPINRSVLTPYVGNKVREVESKQAEFYDYLQQMGKPGAFRLTDYPGVAPEVALERFNRTAQARRDYGGNRMFNGFGLFDPGMNQERLDAAQRIIDAQKKTVQSYIDDYEDRYLQSRSDGLGAQLEMWRAHRDVLRDIDTRLGELKEAYRALPRLVADAGRLAVAEFKTIEPQVRDYRFKRDERNIRQAAERSRLPHPEMQALLDACRAEHGRSGD